MQTKNLNFEFWLIWLKIGVLRAKIGFGLKGKVPQDEVDQKTYFLKSKDILKKL